MVCPPSIMESGETCGGSLWRVQGLQCVLPMEGLHGTMITAVRRVTSEHLLPKAPGVSQDGGSRQCPETALLFQAGR